jgi:hypothetical protein
VKRAITGSKAFKLQPPGSDGRRHGTSVSVIVYTT